MMRNAICSCSENKTCVVIAPNRTLVKEIVWLSSIIRAVLRMYRLCSMYEDSYTRMIKQVNTHINSEQQIEFAL